MAGPYNFFGKFIKNTYERVLQISGSNVLDGSGSLVSILDVTSSYALGGSGSFTGSFTGSFKGDGAGLINVVATASPGGSDTHVQFNDAGTTSGSSLFTFTKTTGAINVTSITSSLFGTSSWSVSSSYALTASYLLGSIASASYADTASYTISSSYSATASYLLGSVTSASYAATSSWAINSITSSFTISSSYSKTASYVNPLIQDVLITGSIFMTGSSAISKVNYIDFVLLPTSSVPAHVEGRVHWIDTTKTLQIDTDVNNFMIEIGHTSVGRIVNKSGNTLLKGVPVYVSGSQGNRPAVYTSSYETSAATLGTAGLVAQDINNNNNGYIVTRGPIRGLNTSTYVEGDLLYVSASGTLTSTRPSAPYHTIAVGIVTTSHATEGVIYVSVDNGDHLEWLHDVLISSPSVGDLLTRSGSIWINSKQLPGDYQITGSLVVTNGISGSLFGTASWANNVLSSSYASTASYLLGTIASASYASTSSWSNNSITASYIATASWSNNSVTASLANTISQYASEYPFTIRAGPLTAGSNTVITKTITTETAVFIEYTLVDTGDSRSGIVMCVINGSNIAYTDTSVEIGTTTPFEWKPQIIGADFVLDALIASGNWTAIITCRYL